MRRGSGTVCGGLRRVGGFGEELDRAPPASATNRVDGVAATRRDAHPTQATVETRKEGDTAGTYDVYYFDPAGKRYRSRAEVARAFFLAVPQRRTKAASTFGRTKKGRRRAAHAKRFAACTQHLRAALGRVLDDEQEAVDPAVLRKQHAEADDRGSKSVAAANSQSRKTTPEAGGI